jgi:hypothetical protein
METTSFYRRQARWASRHPGRRQREMKRPDGRAETDDYRDRIVDENWNTRQGNMESATTSDNKRYPAFVEGTAARQCHAGRWSSTPAVVAARSSLRSSVHS